MGHKKETNNIKLKSSQKFAKFGQFMYLSITNFTNNNLWESASSCAFGFVFSFIPVTLIILTLLITILRASSGLQNYITSFAFEIQELINLDITALLNNILSMKSFQYIDIFLGVWVIWMARKLFISIIQAVNKIFRSVTNRKNWFNQIFQFILEFLFVFLIAAMILLAFAFNQILDSSNMAPLEQIFPLIFSRNSKLLVTIVLYLMLWVISATIFKIISGTNPKLKICMFYSLISTVCFYLLSIFINYTMNLTNYNAVYGTLSSVVILMVKVYFFFVIELFCAQMIYVSQFFDVLLKAEIYLLPDTDDKKLDLLKRKLFVNPASLKKTSNTLFFKAGDIIVHEHDILECVYYIRRGIAIAPADNHIVFKQGSFIGDLECILKRDVAKTIVAKEDCKIIVFSNEEFMNLIQNNPKVASKAITKVSDYTAEFSLAAEQHSKD